jgi:cobalamin biosynthesis protein CbiD
MDAASGNVLRVEMEILAEMAILVETAVLVETTALEETMLEEAMRKHVTIVGSQAISDPIVLTTNERWKHITDFANSSASIATARDRDLLGLSGHALTAASCSSHTTWVIDSGAPYHMCNNSNSFKC